AAHVHLAPLAGGEHGRRVLALAREELDLHPRRAPALPAAPGLELDVVHEEAERAVRERHRVADRRLDGLAPLSRRAGVPAERREDVALLPVLVAHERDAGAAARVVLDRDDGGGDAVLVALEVDQAHEALVPAAAMARGHAPGVVAAAPLAVRDEEVA